MNQSLNTGYILKEDLLALRTSTTPHQAEEYLSKWLKKEWSRDVILIKKFANMLAAHRIGVLNCFDHPVTTSMVEGINNKIKVLKRKAYEFRDIDYFKLRNYFLHEPRYALVG